MPCRLSEQTGWSSDHLWESSVQTLPDVVAEDDGCAPNTTHGLTGLPADDALRRP